MRLDGRCATVNVSTLGERAVVLGVAKLGSRKCNSWRLEIEEARIVASLLSQAADCAEESATTAKGETGK